MDERQITGTSIIWGVYENSDQIEGKGRTVLVDLFTSRHVAQEFAQSRPSAVALPLPLFETLGNRTAYYDEETRKKALTKLTARERELLGLPV